MESVYYMANVMFERFGMPVDVFFGQRLQWFLRMRNAREPETVYYIDEVSE